MFGKDIYWYGVQAISLLEKGELHSPDRSPVFHLVALLFRLFGVSDETLLGFQLLTVTWMMACLIISRYLISFSKVTLITNNSSRLFGVQIKKHMSAMLPCAAIIVSSFLYPKQSWAIGFLMLMFGFYSLNNFRLRWFFLILSLFFASWFHLMIGLLGFGLMFLFFIPKKFELILFLLVLALPFILPNNSDGRLVFDSDIFPITAAFGIAGLGILWDWIFLIYSPVSSSSLRRTFAFLGLLLVLPFLHFADIQYRILLSLLIIKEIYFSGSLKETLITVISFLLWTYTLFEHPNLFRYPYEEMWNPGEKAASFSNNGLLIAHHGFCEYYHFQFNKDCLSWEPDDKAIAELPSGTEIYRLVYGIRFENLRASKESPNKPIFTFIEPMGEYQLVLEKDWKRYLNWLDKKNSKVLVVARSWKNPHRQRPSFLKRKQSYGF